MVKVFKTVLFLISHGEITKNAPMKNSKEYFRTPLKLISVLLYIRRNNGINKIEGAKEERIKIAYPQIIPIKKTYF